MPESACCQSGEVNAAAKEQFSLRGFILMAFRRLTAPRRKRLAVGDLPPELLRDIGFDAEPRRPNSLEDKWRLEMELQSK